MTKKSFCLNSWLIPFIFFFSFWGGDYFSKTWVLEHKIMLPLYVANFFGFIDLWVDVVYNKGAAWGTFSDFFSYLFVLRIVITAFVVYLFIQSRTLIKRCAFALVLAGACGNLTDAVLYKKVVDMIHFTFFQHSFGIFNVADAAIFFGIITLLFSKKTVQDVI